ncbi:MAG: Molybdenum cofactor biosynthesis protein B [Alphaproteobacteria bacterium MarineAlpha5_Bin11]|nr:MAG: Molybdenum cofactor biosynthesis protein B [Alphaproteobacteria bacterium MarineAlpha5_Bin11]PPR52227.1 MAG: Molybdenum cofactor biosynthesis protein B [Alphaproteobacteria bacterium MarineAlpha5_Bin10]|tara:strand:+ start:1479 stop:2009 length:531 start_codon:yes stop_codon:yes gene_type:complete
MAGIDKTKQFISINICILTISDTRNEKTDTSGKLLSDRVVSSGHKIYEKKIVKDEINLITKQLKSWSKIKEVDVILTTGGTGLTGRDSTPEAINIIADKKIEGFGELFRQLSYKKIGTSTIQSRALAATVNGKYIFAIPGSSSACKDAWDQILRFQLDNRFRPCNFVELIPRLSEK